jgi:hypothetical protein
VLCQTAGALAGLVCFGAAEPAGARFKAVPLAGAAARLSSRLG